MRVLPPTARRLPRAAPLVALAAVLALAGCGSQTKTVSVSSAPPQRTQSHSTTASASTTSSSSTTTGVATSAEATEAQPQTTTTTTTRQTTSSRTSSAPAFVEKDEETAHGALGAAMATVERQGYVPDDTAEYHGSQTLRVLIATKGGANGEQNQSGAYTRQAFFFVDEKYIGTDASQPSASIALVSQSDTEVVLEYGLYDSAEAADGHATVHFQLDDGKLAPLDPIPPARPSASAAGRL